MMLVGARRAHRCDPVAGRTATPVKSAAEIVILEIWREF
jgi:hypothetical protein